MQPARSGSLGLAVSVDGDLVGQTRVKKPMRYRQGSMRMQSAAVKKCNKTACIRCTREKSLLMVETRRSVDEYIGTKDGMLQYAPTAINGLPSIHGKQIPLHVRKRAYMRYSRASWPRYSEFLCVVQRRGLETGFHRWLIHLHVVSPQYTQFIRTVLEERRTDLVLENIQK